MTETLDEAWAEAEAALFAVAPQGQAVIEGVSWEKGKDGPPDARYPDRFHARAYRWDEARPWHRLYAEGPSHATALRALAARLRSSADSGTP